MKLVFLAVLFISSFANAQKFSEVYKGFLYHNINTNIKGKKKRDIERLINSHIQDLNKIFKSYNAKNKFDFNYADTLFLIYQHPAENPYNRDLIIWSGKDTISYSEIHLSTTTNKEKYTIEFKKFNPTLNPIAGYKTITERDSLINLAAKGAFTKARLLADLYKMPEGNITTIFVAFKQYRWYNINACYLSAFRLPTTYRKQ